MQKLTLSVDRQVVTGAKRYARARGTSVSRLVETMLRMVALESDPDKSDPGAIPPVLARLRGTLRGTSGADYRRYLENKYR